MKHSQWALLLPAMVLGLIACGGPSQKAQSDLKDAVLRLNEGIRWGRLQEVMPRVNPENAEQFMKMHEKFGTEIQLSDYELINSTYNEKEKKADVVIRITWYRQSEMELFSTILLQAWEYQGMDWMLMTETYQSGQAF
jgi:hypothetical protein